jgi:hypothetical protein
MRSLAFHFSVPDLIRLARIYCEATGISAATLGEISCKNNGVFGGLFSEDNPRLLSDTAERASAWLVANWPTELGWPEDVAHPVDEEAFRRSKSNRLPGLKE